MKLSSLRLITATLLMALILVGSFGKLKIGTLCSLELGGIRMSCPLGFLQSSLASRTVTKEALISVSLVLIITLLLGRFFCAWICPTNLVRWLFKKRVPGVIEARNNGKAARQITQASRTSSAPTFTSGDRFGNGLSYAVLGGTLLSSFLFGFPVFCLICPVGLTFGTLLAIRRLLFGQQPSLELLLFPLLIGLELYVLRSGCIRLCPLGALLKLIGGTPLKIIKPAINPEKCLVRSGINCQACKKACPQAVNLVAMSNNKINDCTNCLDCWKRCPTQAIKLTDLHTGIHLRKK